jgi:CheY-like chemotaxis protein
MSSKLILVLEDNIDFQELIRLAFEQCELEHELLIVSDGVEILDYLFGRAEFGDRDLNEMPRVILLDLDVPRISGLEVLQQIRANQRTRFIPVIITSTSTEPEELINGYSYGCNSYVRKPVDFTQLQNFVREITSYWLTLNLVPPVSGDLDE